MSRKVLDSLLLFFFENNYNITRAEFEDMQVDDIMVVYEILLEKNMYKKREMDRMMA